MTHAIDASPARRPAGRTAARRRAAGPLVALLLALTACGGAEAPPKEGGPAPSAAPSAAADPAAPTPPSSPVAGYTVEAVEAGGRIHGRVLFEGTPPAPEPVVITKDQTVCGASQHTSESLLVDASGGIRDAVVAIDPLQRGKAFPAGTTPVLDQRGCWFVPHVQLLPAGAEIAILNSDGILHNIHTFPNHNPAVNVAQPKFKKRITQSFASPDRVRVNCDVHSWMSAWIVVIGHPYHALTAADGSYALEDVPPGDYTLTVWQESLGRLERPVSIEPGGTLEASFTFGG